MLSQTKVSQFLVGVIKFVHSIDTKFYKNAYNPNPNFLEDLTPHYQPEKDNTYSETILWGLKNPAIKNLALTGPYGSGKSSILTTFETDHPEFNYLNISLASFWIFRKV